MEEKLHRYSRQLLLKEFGTEGQQRLLHGKVLVIGAGGLGCPALQYLAAAGAGTIGIVDFDVVDLTNLQRQVLYATEDIGKPKAETAAKKLRALNPEVEIKVHNTRLTNQNALEIIADYDLVIDGSDNFSTRYLVNDACVLLDKPLVYGAVFRFEGQVGVFNLADKSGAKTNYRDMFPVRAEADFSCNEAGVLGVLPGVIGTMQATEAIKILAGIGEPLCNKIITFNALQNTFYEFCISPNETGKQSAPKNEAAFRNYKYDFTCSTITDIAEISPEEFDILHGEKDITIIDVRELHEQPELEEISAVRMPFSGFPEKVHKAAVGETVVVICQSGKRSLEAGKILQERNPECKVYSLQGGIEAWKLMRPVLCELQTKQKTNGRINPDSEAHREDKKEVVL